WRSILPPATTPPDVVQHPSLGRADTTWTYCDATGTSLLVVCRWNRIGRSKTILPISYGVLNGTEGWHFKHLAAPRPLFGLDRLAARPNAEVLLVEGEKAADAAQRLLPKMVAMTWPGGANAIRHADWTTLAGRTIIIWPDNDEAGRKAGKTVAGLLRRVGAAKINLIDPPANVCQGWDLADAASDGWDSQRVASWLANHSRALSAGRTVQRSDGEEPRSPRFSDDQLALRFTAELGDELRYIHPWGKWLRWDGRRWSFDQTLAVPDRARGICRVAATECWDPKEQNAIASAKKVAAVERLARSDRQHAATVEQWDTNPWLLPTPVGEVSLRLGEISPARPEHYMTKITAVAPEGECPLWQQFLERVTGGDKELQLYLQRVVGYCLTGSVEEEALFFLHGTGQNGKGVFIHTLAGIFGEFHTAAPMEMFLFSKHDRHPTELAGLRGARLVTCTEVEQGRRWDEAKIKALTGSDTISARFMRQDFFNFIPTFKLMISGNHKPSLSHVDKAISRRFHLIPFTVTIPDDERDDKLAEKLKGEWPGILQWAIDGAVEWARIGLAPPEAVLEATQEYLSAQDSISLWIEEHCTEGANEQETIAKLWTSWRTWCDQTNDYAGKKSGFVEALVTRGYRRTTIGKAGAKGLSGIRLLRTEELGIEPS
ncbi:MAG: phage/plasmid primase, P4 family, partial [Alphaproteobacteria bacterium]|nr:phage/plasmid primase, P4 family [Alphaproteobacteria bacterium]